MGEVFNFRVSGLGFRVELLYEQSVSVHKAVTAQATWFAQWASCGDWRSLETPAEEYSHPFTPLIYIFPFK